ncbi:MAG TPA: tetratricopeptide repeat protein [Vulgatibacter sp.]
MLGCASCAATVAEWRGMDELLRDRPSPWIPAERRAGVLAAVLEDAFPANVPQRGRRPLWIWGSFAGAAAVAAAILLVVGGSHTVPPEATPLAQGPVYRGSIRAHADARFGRESGAPDEIVRLYEGAISVDVEKLQAGERFRVIVGDGEVEVRGTSFDVLATGDRLALVRVDHGVVEVKPADRPMARLQDGERWEATVEKAEAAPSAPEETEPPRRRRAAVVPPAKAPAEVRPELPAEAIVAPAPIARAAPPPRHPMAELFDKGWKQLRDGHPRDAANTFGEALAMDPTDALAEDASFWRGVALVRAKASKEAMGALTAFLDAYPGSARAGETSALLGWILLEKGDVDGAEKRFRAAEADPVASVRASARKGLDAVQTTRQNQADPR